MRSIIMAVLLAGIAAPAVAQHTFASDPRDERRARTERAEPETEAAERQVRAERRARMARGTFGSSPDGANSSQAASQGSRPDGFDSVRSWRADQRRRADSPAAVHERNLSRGPAGRSGGFVEQERPLPQVIDRNPGRMVSGTPTFGAAPPAPATTRTTPARPGRGWRIDWRQDDRYDWYDYRRRHRSLFDVGFYSDPFGWTYHRYGIGWQLWPSHYSSRYWMHDPWMYRLPRGYGPYRWVRYWDDALLVNIDTGQVVDVIHDFFW